jgi:8-oxo-dGTP diphosphatase
MALPGSDFPGVGTGLAVLRDGKLLLYRRMKAPEAGYWSIVGGKVDHMEPAADAARREAEEESGLAIGKIDYLCTTEQIIAADRQHWVSVIYVCKDFSGEASLVEPDKLSAFGWFGRSELPEPLSAFAEAAIVHLDEDDLR